MDPDYTYPRFSDAEYERRYELIYKEMEKNNLDCLIIYGGHRFHNQSFYRWVNNVPSLIKGFIVFPKKGEPTCFSGAGSSHSINAWKYSSISDQRPGGADSVVKRIKELKLDQGKIGIVGRRLFPHVDWVELKGGLPGATIIDTTDFEHLQWVLSPEEIAFMKKAGELTDMVLYAMVEHAKPGITERELYGKAAAAPLPYGGRFAFLLMGFTPMADPRMSFPDLQATDRKLRVGDIIQNETSIEVEPIGYSGQLASPIYCGEPTKEYRDLHEITVEVYHRAIRALKPGTIGHEVLKDVTTPAIEGGYKIPNKPPFWHLWGLGQGGMPQRPFEKNMPVMIQPNVVKEEGFMGIFMGAVFLVTEFGGKCIQKYPVEQVTIV